MRLADAPEDDAADGATITLTPALFGRDARVAKLFAPFRECVVLHETLTRDRGTSGPSRLLMAEIRADRFDVVCDGVRNVCSMSLFTEKPSENDDVAAGMEWRERGGGSFSVMVYRLFGGSTSIHVTSAKGNAVDAQARAIIESPLAVLADVVADTSFVEHVSCSRGAGEVPAWHLQASLREARRFDEIATRVAALGFEDRRGKHWLGKIIVQPVGQQRWMAAMPGLELGSRR